MKMFCNFHANIRVVLGLECRRVNQHEFLNGLRKLRTCNTPTGGLTLVGKEETECVRDSAERS